jgi:aminoglycoside/choline kinase family phosphotransferase
VKEITNTLSNLFKEWTGEVPDQIIQLPVSGSDRKFFRVSYRDRSAIGVWNPIIEENEAYLYFSGHFNKYGLHIPEVYAVDNKKYAYLLEDLGDVSLFTLVDNQLFDDVFPGEVEKYYRDSLDELIRFQVIAGKDLDYSHCYPHSSFDERSIKWDLNYFKYYFLKLHIPFHEGKLEDDFESLTGYLTQVDSGYFMYRDFQSRNIMIHEGKPFFIDFQGGRKGPLQYDVASLLFQVKANLPFDLRERLLCHYMDELSKSIRIDQKLFREQYFGFVLIRLIQVLGAYGFRGMIEKKQHFMASIPFALKNLSWWLDNVDLWVEMPELLRCLKELTRIEKFNAPVKKETGKLTVMLRSFSYKNGLPEDNNGNGGGFVFDCRALPNPGREEHYRAFNGKDKIIIDYLKDEPDVIRFLDETGNLVSQSIDNYLHRGFSNLSVSFGCTGGQHRSVYCTETMARRIRERYPEVVVVIEHIMLNI